MNEVDAAIVNAVAWILLVVPILPLVVALLLLPSFCSPNMPLRERTGIAMRDAFLAGVIGLLAAVYLFDWSLDPIVLFWLSVLAYLSISVPSGIWLVLYLRGRFA